MIDVTVPVRTGMVVYEGDPPVRRELAQSMAAGGICNVSRLACGVHTGTHIDAPVHFIEGAAGIEATPLDALIGDACVVDATSADGDIDAATLRRLIVPDGVARVLFKTPNSRLWGRPSFAPDFVGLTADAAQVLVARGVRLVGIDYLSIAPKRDPAPTHVALLSAGVVILEGLDLRAVTPGAYRLICLPLLLEGSDGAPARALLVDDGGEGDGR
ncbi:MAG: cyclase family protein [Chloroflexota bacterium]|nr:cyclase family protein [Chloroflexota bacterium]